MLRGQTSVWTTAESGSWTDGDLWSNGVPNGVGHVAAIEPDEVLGRPPMTISIGQPIRLGELSVGPGPRLTVVGASVQWETGSASPAAVTVSSLRGSSAFQFQSDQIIQDSQGLTVDVAATSSLEITGRISGNGLVKVGRGGVVLNSDNSDWNAPIWIKEGGLVVSNPNALGSASAGTTIENGLLRLAVATDEPIQISGGVLEVAAAQRGPIVASGGTVQVRSAISSPIIHLHGATVEARGSIHPNSLLNASSTGGTYLVLQTANYTAGGQVFDWSSVNGGDNLRLGTVDATTLPATLSLIPPASGTIRLGGGKGVMTVRSAIQDFQGQPTSLDYVGPGNAILVGNNTYSGLTTVRDGMLTVDHANALGVGTKQASDGTRVEDGGVLMIARPAAASELILLDGGEVRFGALTTPVDLPIQIESNGRFAATTRPITLQNVTSNGGTATFAAGNFVLDRSLAFNGPIQVAGATVNVTNQGALGTGQFPTTVQNGNLILSVNSSEPIHVEGGRLTLEPTAIYTGKLTASGGMILPKGGFPEDIAPELQGGRTTLALQQSTYSSGVTGTGALVLSGGNVEQTGKPFAHLGDLEIQNGLIRLSVANLYSGVTEIRDSSVIMAHPQAFGTLNGPTRILPGGNLTLDTITDEPLILAGGTLDWNVDPVGRTIQVESGGIRLTQPTRANFHISDGGVFQVYQGVFLGSFSGTGELRLAPPIDNITLSGDSSAFQGPIVIDAAGDVAASNANAFGDPTVPTMVDNGVLRVTVPVAERFILRNRGTISQISSFTHVPDFDDRTWSGPVAKTWNVMQNATLTSPIELQRTQLNAYADVHLPELTLVDNLAAATTTVNGQLHVQGNVHLQRGTFGGDVTVDGDILKSTPGIGVLSGATSLASNVRVHEGDLHIKSDFRMVGQGKKIFVDAAPFTRLLVKDATRVTADIELADGAGSQQEGALIVTQSGCCETVLDGNLTIAGKRARIAGGTNLVAEWAGQLHGGDLEITGGLRIVAPQTDYHGALTINGGRLSFAESGSFPLVPQVHVVNNATFSFGDDRRTPRHTSRLNPSTELILGDAELYLANLSIPDVTERVGATQLRDGYTTVAMIPFSNSRLQLSSLQRNGRSMLDIQAGDGQLVVDAPVPMTNGIVNWATINGKLATFSQGAFRELQATRPFVNALASEHALIDGTMTMSADRTVASLTFQSGELDLGGHQLTVGTGALSSGAVISNGTLTSGDSQGELFLSESRIGASIVDQPGRAVNVILNNTELSGNNTYTGSTTVLNFVSRLLTPNSLPDGTDLLIGSQAFLQGFFAEPLSLGKLRMAHSSFLESAGGVSFTSAEIEGASIGQLIGNGPLTKRGHGQAMLANSPNYSGSVRVEDGTLGVAMSLGTGTLTLAGGELIVGAGELFTNPLEIDSGKIQVNGPLNAPMLIRDQVVFSGGGLAGKISGNGTFVLSNVNSTDVTVFSSDLSDFRGAFVVDSGVLYPERFSGDLQIRANGALQLHDQTAVRKVMLQGGTIRTTQVASGNLAGDANISGNSQLEVSNGTRLVLSGATDLDRSAKVSLVGEGIVELAGSVRLNSEARFVGLQPQLVFSGNLETTQPQSTLTLDLVGQQASPFQGRLTVHSGQVLQVVDRDQQFVPIKFETATGVLAGAGRLANSVQLANNATIEPGERDRVGQLRLDGNATLADAHLVWDFQASAPNVTHDELLVGGTVEFGAANGLSVLTLRGVTANGQIVPMTNLLNGSNQSWPLIRSQSLVGFDAKRYEIEVSQLLAPNQIALRHGLQLRADTRTLWLDYDPLAAGDFDRDGQLDVGDLSPLYAAIQTQTGSPSLDLNRDQQWTFEDLEVWVGDRAMTYFGDANLDGEFNSRDLVDVFVAGTYEDLIPRNSTWETGDWNADGDFTSSDLVTAFQSGGYERGPRTAVASEAVPEPAGLAWLFGCAILVRYGRREPRRALRSAECDRIAAQDKVTSR